MAQFASNGKANAGLTTGIIGSALGVLNSGVLNGTLFGGNNTQYASKTDLQNAILLAQKDSQISMLKAQQASQIKMQDIYERLGTKINQNKAQQDAINAQQAVFNTGATSGISVLQSQVSQLMGLTKMVIPNGNVCPGWGTVTVSPAFGGTTTA